MTYAAYVALVGASMLAPETSFNAQPVEAKNKTWLVSVGTNAKGKSDVGQDGFLTAEYLSYSPLLWELKPNFAIGLSVDGGGFVGAGVRKDFAWGPVVVTPSFGPVLFQSDLGRFESKELIQFKTGIDASIAVAKNAYVGVGVFHISNAGLTKSSAGVDVTRVSVRWNY